jgi:uncharacterized membrane protein
MEVRARRESWSLPLFWLILAFGVLFALVTPPFQAPDERWHFFRAFGVSEGHLFLGASPGGVGLWLPTSVVDLLSPESGSLQFHPERKTDIRATRTAFAIRLDPSRRVLLRGLLAGYSFVTYLPQAAGIALARLFSDSVLVLFYAGRVVNAAVSALLFALAVRRATPARPILFVLSLMPMVVFLAGSHSADAVTNGVAFLFIGSVLGLAAADSPILNTGEVLELFGLSVLLGLAKPAYVLLPALVFLVPVRRFGSRARQYTLCVGLVSVCAGAMLGWTAIVWHVFLPEPGANAIDQARHVLESPFGFIAVTIRHYLNRFPALANQWVGKLGWLDTSLPVPLSLAVLLTVLVVALTGASRYFLMTVRRRIGITAVLVASALWLTALLYLFANPVGSSTIIGTQGRYFIPLGPLAFLLFYNQRWIVDWERRRIVLAIWAGTWLAGALVAVVFRYYVAGGVPPRGLH